MTDYSKLPDRDIDSLVAERVMGWSTFGPKFSHDANLALEAAKKFEAAHPNENVILNTDGGDGWHAHASVFLRNGDAWHSSPARAICEAILLATEPE